MPRKTILLNDSPDLLSTLEDSFLARDGFALLRAGTAAEILAMAEEKDPALILLDPARPGMAECCRILKADLLLREIPVLLVGPSHPPSEAPGAEEVFAPPISRSSLLEAACRLLNIVVRAAPRLAVSLPIRYGRNSNRLKPGRTTDLSRSGLYLAGDLLFPVDTEIDMILALEPGEELHGRGCVAWVNHPEWLKKPALPPGMGIRFISFKEDGEGRLHCWLSKVGYTFPGEEEGD